MNITQFERFSQIPAKFNLNIERRNLQLTHPETAYTTRQSIWDANETQKDKYYTPSSTMVGTHPRYILGRLYGDDPKAEWSVKRSKPSTITRPASKCNGANCIPEVIRLKSKRMAEDTMKLNLRHLALSTRRYDYAPQRLENK